MNLQEQISRIQSMMGVINESSETTDDVVGKEFWFEYHCFESPKSCDAELWYRTHNKVLVLSIVEHGCLDTKLERLLEGCPRVYRVVFEDGFEYVVFEDELMESKEEFERPDAPKRNQQEHIRKVLKEDHSEKMIMLIGKYLNVMYSGINKKDVFTEEYEDTRGYSVISFHDLENHAYFGKYHYGTKELQLSERLFNELENLFNDEMEYVIDWFNNEFDLDAEYVTYYN
jgi:hypothetical protein